MSPDVLIRRLADSLEEVMEYAHAKRDDEEIQQIREAKATLGWAKLYLEDPKFFQEVLRS